MELLGKIKIHELAKEIGMSSKDVLEKAKSLGIDVTSHLSNVTDEQATEIITSSAVHHSPCLGISFVLLIR